MGAAAIAAAILCAMAEFASIFDPANKAGWAAVGYTTLFVASFCGAVSVSFDLASRRPK